MKNVLQSSRSRYWWRRLKSSFMLILVGASVLVALTPLGLILYQLAAEGLRYLDWNFFTQLPHSPQFCLPGQPCTLVPAGMANAIVGSLTLVGLALLFSLPLGLLAGIYLAEFGSNRFGQAVRFTADLLNAAPSIVAGVFIYTLIVTGPLHLGFSAYAGGAALGILMVATITRSTEEMLRTVPHSLREAALALGVSRWKLTLRVVLRTALGGIVTGVMLAVARAAGETAPLLLTSLNNNFWPHSLSDPTPSLPYFIFYYATSPFKQWQQQAWAAALVLVGMILILNIIAKLLSRKRFARR
ncbi:MAG TPA: phosphate ABC transporter permease PstA [Candidatus Fraserbacteria bacterium]|nr:phosphate ABC transporter permease PstA [Candidatus Fraserbacteria bacterium]